MVDNTGKEQHHGFKPGVSGNPKGRPKGSRNKFSEAFLSNLCEDFEEHGAAAIQRVRENDPSTYMRVCAALIPKEMKVEQTNDLSHLSDEELDARLVAAQKKLASMSILH
jgi:hypothetical protein